MQLRASLITLVSIKNISGRQQLRFLAAAMGPRPLLEGLHKGVKVASAHCPAPNSCCRICLASGISRTSSFSLRKGEVAITAPF
jgi:hypothetical protein